MRDAQAAGFDWPVDPLPALSPDAQLAAHCWRWCEGWRPERWPVYAALHDVPDWHRLAELMRAIRNEADQ